MTCASVSSLSYVAVSVCSLQLTPHYSPFLSLHLHPPPVFTLSFAPILSLNLHLSSPQTDLLALLPFFFSFSHFPFRSTAASFVIITFCFFQSTWLSFFFLSLVFSFVLPPLPFVYFSPPPFLLLLSAQSFWMWKMTHRRTQTHSHLPLAKTLHLLFSQHEVFLSPAALLLMLRYVGQSKYVTSLYTNTQHSYLNMFVHKYTHTVGRHNST